MTKTKTSETHPDQTCHECGSSMIRDTRPFRLEYKDDVITVDQPGWYCTKCDEVVLSSDDCRTTDPAASAQRARVDGLLTPDEVRRIRKRLRLSQRRAGELLGGGPRAFQKYERGAIGVSKAMSNLLRLLDQNPSLLASLDSGKAA